MLAKEHHHELNTQICVSHPVHLVILKVLVKFLRMNEFTLDLNSVFLRKLQTRLDCAWTRAIRTLMEIP